MVVRRALDVFDCTRGPDGRWTLDSDPSLGCWAPDATVHAALVPWAGLSLALYGLGVPLAFARVLHAHSAAIVRDQKLWLIGRGEVLSENADIRIRRRYSKLYQVTAPGCIGAAAVAASVARITRLSTRARAQDYKPEYRAYRIVLLTRKFVHAHARVHHASRASRRRTRRVCLVMVTVLSSDNGMFQASVCLAILAVGYAVHARHQPFVNPDCQVARGRAHDRVVPCDGAGRGRRS